MSLARQIVDFAIKAGSSDIHLEEGSPIAIRVNSAAGIRLTPTADITIYMIVFPEVMFSDLHYLV